MNEGGNVQDLCYIGFDCRQYAKNRYSKNRGLRVMGVGHFDPAGHCAPLLVCKIRLLQLFLHDKSILIAGVILLSIMKTFRFNRVLKNVFNAAIATPHHFFSFK